MITNQLSHDMKLGSGQDSCVWKECFYYYEINLNLHITNLYRQFYHSSGDHHFAIKTHQWRIILVQVLEPQV